MSEAKVKQLLHCISLICSYMRTFPIKVHYKMMEFLAIRWLGTKIFKETQTTSDESYPGGLLGTTTKSV